MTKAASFAWSVAFLCLAVVKSVKNNDALSNGLILLDVDNTLYDEKVYGIERQIVKNIHRFCEEELQMSADEADKLHREYGSTIEGIQQTLWKGFDQSQLEKHLETFYRKVYDDVDVSVLLKQDHSGAGSTGYSHSKSQQQRLALKKILQLPRSSFGIASNSPGQHVRKVLQALGLADVNWDHIMTPDSCSNPEANVLFPTKLRGTDYFQDTGSILLDDSETVLANLPQYIQGIHVSERVSLLEGLSVAMGWIGGGLYPSDGGETYTFDQVQYLKEKNRVDFESIHVGTWKRLGKELSGLLSCGSSEDNSQHLDIVDVGAGLLSMLDLVTDGYTDRLPSLFNMLRAEGCKRLKSVDYYAYESNREVGYAASVRLQKVGFDIVDTLQFHHEGSECIEWTMRRLGTGSRPAVTVHLRFWDYQLEAKRPQPTPHLIIGCCFADLLDPDTLSRSMLRLLAENRNSFSATLLYFPITFTGVTQVLPPQPFQRSTTGLAVPSDTLAFYLYACSLEEEHHHNLDPRRLQDALKSYGSRLLNSGSSDWKIDAAKTEYLWRTMLYFFGSVAAPALEAGGWDASGWLYRMKTGMPIVQAVNVDLLFSLPHLGCWTPIDMRASSNQDNCSNSGDFHEILFTAPNTVTSVQRESQALQPHQVRIKSTSSLISSGTELKIFKGLFDDAALDVNIEDMSGDRMAYPLAYGYSLVGKIVECGTDVPNSRELIGRYAFTFSAHASEVVTSYEAIQIVPDGINPLDAIFMPSVETALSIVHDAHARFGEDVAVFGQGLIGLLVTAVLQSQGLGIDGRLGSLSTFDFVPDRLAMSARLGSGQALFPTLAGLAGPFDVAIEVSGNGKGLQSAIDSTRDGGRVVVASWYGNKQVDLRLGIEFHRSHKAIKTSQVSDLPAEMKACWTKERRFALTWELVRKLRPSRLITQQYRLEEAQPAYESLERGEDIAISFSYE